MKSLFVFALLTLSSLSAFAQPGRGFIVITGNGVDKTTPINPNGNTTINGLKPGKYQFGLLLPAVQKSREAAGKATGKQIEIESFSWGAGRAGAASQGAGMGAGKVSMQDINFTRVPSMTLPAQMTKHNGEPYYKVEMEDLLVSSFQSGGSSGSEQRPTESVSLNFTKIEWK